MNPSDAIARIHQLGASIDVAELSKVENVHVLVEEIPAKYAAMIQGMLPGTVTLDGSRMTAADVDVLLHFSSVEQIVAHRVSFAAVLLSRLATFANLKSIAMSFTPIRDVDLAGLANRSGLKSIHFAGTQLTDSALSTLGTLPDLELLDLRQTLVTNDGLQMLHHLTNLFTIDVRGTAVTVDGANQFRRSVAHVLPDLEVLI
jgi:hypothetical protein